jgi:hypothetical protein
MAGFNISTFQTALSAQGARPNLFDMTITKPTTAITGVSDTKLASFNTMCKTAQIPGSTIGVVEVQYFGRPVKLPGNRTFENLTTTIINDEGFLIRHAMESWMAFLNTHKGNITTSVGGTAGSTLGFGYTGTLSLQQYNKGGTAATGQISPYLFENVWPVNVAPIDLDWGTNDTIEEFTVEWAYDWWSNADSAST